MVFFQFKNKYKWTIFWMKFNYLVSMNDLVNIFGFKKNINEWFSEWMNEFQLFSVNIFGFEQTDGGIVWHEAYLRGWLNKQMVW